MSPKAKHITQWVLSALLCLVFLGAGGFKIMDQEGYYEQLPQLDLDLTFILVIGIIEVLGAIAIIIPKTRFYGALWLGGTMVGATISHLMVPEFAPPSIVLGLLCAVVACLSVPGILRQKFTKSTD